MAEPLLAVRDLRVRFHDRAAGRPHEVLRGVDLEVAAGESLALVGPSGSGKSLTARAVLGLLPAAAHWQGEVCWMGRRLRDPGGADWAAVRGSGMTLVLQEPATALDPVLTVGGQIAEVLRHHLRLGRRQARRRAVALLEEVHLADPQRVADSFPHQLSGGMRQRALLAGALACDPRLLIADEITSSLDAGTRAGILTLLDGIRRDRGMALLFITHDLALVPVVCERCARLDQGRIAEIVPAVSPAPVPPVPPVRSPVVDTHPVPLLRARGLVGGYPGSRSPLIEGVDLELQANRALGLAGESGSGKTTLARLLARHLVPQGGSLELGGEDFLAGGGAEFRRARRRIQVLFQDPGGTLDPRQRLVDAVREAAGGPRSARSAALAARLLDEVGLPADLADRLPHELSGGQKQRSALARCLAADPLVLIADEPTSNLDPDAARLVLAVLRRTMSARGLALLLISHDLELLLGMCDTIAVMLAGRILETFPAAAGGRHPYTRLLLGSAEDQASPGAVGFARPGERPLAPGGCPFAGRCPLCKPACEQGIPPARRAGPGHWLRCPEVP